MESYVHAANGTTVPSNRGPVQLNTAPAPIVPMNRWAFEDKKRLRKRYEFSNVSDRNHFVFQLLQYEELKKHSADLLVSELFVEVSVQTKQVESVTDIDKEYAKMCDIIYKDINVGIEHRF